MWAEQKNNRENGKKEKQKKIDYENAKKQIDFERIVQ